MVVWGLERGHLGPPPVTRLSKNKELAKYGQCAYNVITMKAKVIKIGNSRGIRLPKAILDEVGLGEEVVLEASRGAVIIRPASKPRAAWGAAFQKMAACGDDQLIDTDLSASAWDKKEWEWK